MLCSQVASRLVVRNHHALNAVAAILTTVPTAAERNYNRD